MTVDTDREHAAPLISDDGEVVPLGRPTAAPRASGIGPIPAPPISGPRRRSRGRAPRSVLIGLAVTVAVLCVVAIVLTSGSSAPSRTAHVNASLVTHAVRRTASPIVTALAIQQRREQAAENERQAAAKRRTARLATAQRRALRRARAAKRRRASAARQRAAARRARPATPPARVTTPPPVVAPRPSSPARRPVPTGPSASCREFPPC